MFVTADPQTKCAKCGQSRHAHRHLACDSFEEPLTLEQRAWAIVHEAAPEWHNKYAREFPNSKVDAQRRAEEMAHYCVMAALRRTANSL